MDDTVNKLLCQASRGLLWRVKHFTYKQTEKYLTMTNSFLKCVEIKLQGLLTQTTNNIQKTRNNNQKTNRDYENRGHFYCHYQ